jgi:O-antigen/teichoic acid export membrane protein
VNQEEIIEVMTRMHELGELATVSDRRAITVAKTSMTSAEETSDKKNATVVGRMRLRLQSLIGGDGLKARVFRGGAWLGVGSASEQILRFVRNMILARLLAPSAFGTMAIVMSAAALLQAFTEVGAREALIQNPKGRDPEYVNAAWWMAFGRATFVYFILFALAPWVAKFYGNPQLTSLLRVATIGLVLEGAISTRAYIAMKDMRFSRWAAITHGGGILGVIITVILGFVLRDVWALVIGTCAESGARCVLSYIICPNLPSFKFDREAFKGLIQFSKGLFGLAPLVIIYMRMDIFVLGKLIPTAALGYYSLGISVAQVPAGFISNLIAQILMPAMSHVQEDRARTRRIVLQVTAVVVFMAMPAVVFAYFCGRSVLTLIYGQAYSVAAMPLFLAACCALVAFVNNQITTAFYAAGKPQAHRLCVVMMAVVMIGLTYPLAKLVGPTGGQLAALASITVGFLIQLNRARYLIGTTLSDYGRVFVQGLSASAVAAVICLVAQQTAAVTRPIFVVALGLFGCVASYAIAAWLLERSPKMTEDYT